MTDAAPRGMPDPDTIVRGLAALAEHYWQLAAGFHLAFLVLALIALVGWRPSNPLMAGILLVPVGTVAVIAGATDSVFNSGVFLVLTVALALSAATMPRFKVNRGPAWAVVAGLALTGFGLAYPHFSGESVAILWRAPIGVLPCPTLALVIGMTLVLGGLGSRLWSAIVASAGLFYGLFGALRLGVWIDLALAAGAAMLMVLVVVPASRRRAHRAGRASLAVV